MVGVAACGRMRRVKCMHHSCMCPYVCVRAHACTCARVRDLFADGVRERDEDEWLERKQRGDLDRDRERERDSGRDGEGAPAPRPDPRANAMVIAARLEAKLKNRQEEVAGGVLREPTFAAPLPPSAQAAVEAASAAARAMGIPSQQGAMPPPPALNSLQQQRLLSEKPCVMRDDAETPEGEAKRAATFAVPSLPSKPPVPSFEKPKPKLALTFGGVPLRASDTPSTTPQSAGAVEDAGAQSAVASAASTPASQASEPAAPEAAQSLQEGNGDAAGQGSSELMGLIGDYDDDAE
eukprot:Tamp_02956.p1 GENE.Tamp_02956~~Tamp_02956.p1  ORF type:complete len:294 (+),score=64.13 Tamp_02956:512-1393(+)